MTEKNIGFIGLGYWGKNLLRNFYELGVLKTASDKSESVIAERRKDFSDVSYAQDYKDILNDPEIKAVAIATPAATHYSIAKEALLAGKDVFVEKPLALNVAEGEELVKIAEDTNKILMVGHLLHYHPAVTALKNLISKESLGRIQYVYSNRLNFGKIRREENILWSFAPHDISLILSLLGAEPDEVSARGSSYLHPDIADVTLSHLKFQNGVNAHIFVSWLHPFKEQKLVVVGEKQMAVFDDTAPWDEKLMLYPHEVVWTNGVPEAKKAEGDSVPLEQGEPLKSECQHFIECVEKRNVPLTDGCEGARVLSVLNSLQKSLDNNGDIVYARKQSTDYFMHETAVVDEGAAIGPKSKVWHFSHVMSGAKLGEKCNVGQNVVISPNVIIGNNVKIQNNVSVYTGVKVEDDVFLGPSMVFTNVTNPRSFIERKNEYKDTIIKKGATIGANSTIVCGNNVGKYAFIGAGAVVTKDVPSYALVYGNPARITGWMCKCGIKLNMDINDKVENASCDTCGQTYERNAYELREK